MIPTFFGRSEQPLFGVYSPPTGTPRSVGVLICPPIAHQFVAFYWALRQLAERLAANGFPVFRFSYFGLGDSAGCFEDARLEQWRQDTLTAAQELRDQADVPRLSVVGVGIGGVLATQISHLIPLQTLLLWEPVVQGRYYLKRLVDLEWTRPRARVDERKRVAGPEFAEMLGFRYRRALLDDLLAVELAASVPRASRVAMVVGQVGSEVQDLRQRWTAAGCPLVIHEVADSAAWSRVENQHQQLVANQSLQVLVDSLREGST